MAGPSSSDHPRDVALFNDDHAQAQTVQHFEEPFAANTGMTILEPRKKIDRDAAECSRIVDSKAGRFSLGSNEAPKVFRPGNNYFGILETSHRSS